MAELGLLDRGLAMSVGDKKRTLQVHPKKAPAIRPGLLQGYDRLLHLKQPLLIS
jgi:hypothetical protein